MDEIEQKLNELLSLFLKVSKLKNFEFMELQKIQDKKYCLNKIIELQRLIDKVIKLDKYYNSYLNNKKFASKKVNQLFYLDEAYFERFVNAINYIIKNVKDYQKLNEEWKKIQAEFLKGGD